MKKRRMGFGGLRRRLALHLRFGAVAYAVLVIALAFALFMYLYARQSVQSDLGVRFQETVVVSERALERRTSSYLDALLASRAFLAVSGREVRDDKWQRYVSGLEFKSRYRGLQALGYVRWLNSPEKRRSYGAEAVNGDAPPVVTVPGADTLAPVKLAGPSDLANRDLLGRDLFSEAPYRRAMQAARDSGEPRATGRVNVLVQNREAGNATFKYSPGFFVFVPVYAEGEPTGGVEERRGALEGFVFGSFRTDDLMREIVPPRVAPDLDFEVYDGRQSRGNLLYDSDGVVRAGDPGFDPRYSGSPATNVAGRRWSLYLASLPSFVAGERRSLPNLALFAGLVTALALFAATWLLSASRERAEEATRKLEDANRRLEVSNRELESFSYSVSHDLRAPLRSIDGFSRILEEDYAGALGPEGASYLGRVRRASSRMANLIDDLLLLSRVTRAPLNRRTVHPTEMAWEVATELQRRDPERQVAWKIRDTPTATCDPGLLRIVLENLLDNAWKFTENSPLPTVEFDYAESGPNRGYFVRDNGAGFDERYVEKLFGAFQRLHTAEEFEGTGIGLATVARIVGRHGGEVGATGAVGEGATFRFTLEPPGGPPKSPGEKGPTG